MNPDSYDRENIQNVLLNPFSSIRVQPCKSVALTSLAQAPFSE